MIRCTMAHTSPLRNGEVVCHLIWINWRNRKECQIEFHGDSDGIIDAYFSLCFRHQYAALTSHALGSILTMLLSFAMPDLNSLFSCQE